MPAMRLNSSPDMCGPDPMPGDAIVSLRGFAFA